MGLATFRGKHNANKSKTYWLPRWCRWHRLSRRKRNGYLEYRITQRGIQWFREWIWLMPLSRYMAEIREWQEKHKSSL
jgi:hypothetical protein